MLSIWNEYLRHTFVNKTTKSFSIKRPFVQETSFQFNKHLLVKKKLKRSFDNTHRQMSDNFSLVYLETITENIFWNEIIL